MGQRRELSKTKIENAPFLYARLWEQYRASRPHFVASDSFGYSGSGRYANDLDLWAECHGDLSAFSRLSWQVFEKRWETVSEMTKRDVAQMIADRLIRLADGPLHLPETWRNVAKLNDVEVQEYDMPGGCPGECVPVHIGDTGIVAGAIGINTSFPEIDQARIWIHELSHLVLFAWLPPLLANAADVCRYDGDRDDVSHQIARIVEDFVLWKQR